jgi:hypothetical protein
MTSSSSIKVSKDMPFTSKCNLEITPLFLFLYYRGKSQFPQALKVTTFNLRPYIVKFTSKEEVIS